LRCRFFRAPPVAQTLGRPSRQSCRDLLWGGASAPQPGFVPACCGAGFNLRRASARSCGASFSLRRASARPWRGPLVCRLHTRVETSSVRGPPSPRKRPLSRQPRRLRRRVLPRTARGADPWSAVSTIVSRPLLSAVLEPDAGNHSAASRAACGGGFFRVSVRRRYPVPPSRSNSLIHNDSDPAARATSIGDCPQCPQPLHPLPRPTAVVDIADCPPKRAPATKRRLTTNPSRSGTVQSSVCCPYSWPPGAGRLTVLTPACSGCKGSSATLERFGVFGGVNGPKTRQNPIRWPLARLARRCCSS
jgi:hypothetical protein